MNLDHICNHFTAGQAVIDSVCSLAFAVTDIGAVIACTKSAFLCNSFPYLFLQDIQVAAARMTVTMKASLGILKDAMGRKVAILGDMGELGENEKELHREVGTFAGNCGIDLLICVGTLAKEIAGAAKESSIQAEKQLEAVSFDTLEELLMHLGEQVKQGDTILVKASHFMNFGKIVEALQK